MGCDGGTIPKRDELVKTKKKPEKKDKTAERAFRWKHCAISQQPLQQPIVGCELGRLYSKETVLETLLEKAEGTPAVAAHIRSLKDVKELKLTENPTWTAETSFAEVGDGYIDAQKSEWICPVSGQEMNGTFKFCLIWNCGCVLSDKALKEMRKANPDTSECLRCQKPFSFDDVIIINPTEEEEQERQAEKMSTRRLQAKKNKKSSKKRDAPETVSSTEAGAGTSNGELKVNGEGEHVKNGDSSKSKINADLKAGSSKSLNGSINGSDIPAKKSKLSSSTSASSSKPNNPSKGSTSYSVSEDPNASETYKSLFTTHKTAQSQQKAHWVTYNPFYN